MVISHRTGNANMVLNRAWRRAAKVVMSGLLFMAAVTMTAAPVFAQTNPIPSRDVDVQVDSGIHVHRGAKPEVVWSDLIEVEDAQWMRLEFSHLVLAEDPIANTSSILRIVSMKDGAEQTLDATIARQWRNTSAYFNGDAVALELIAWPNGRSNRVVVGNVIAGEIPDQVGIESICDSVDDRILSDDVRAGRAMPVGCTAWLFNDRKYCMTTAGHCASGGSLDVIEFNVPLSNSNGSVNHPGPEDQYTVDPASVQFVNGGIGNDWCYFGAFANSQTGLTAFEAQGDSYQLEFPPDVQQGDEIRITGYGTVSPPVDPRWNQVQKTHVGPYWSFSASTLGYRTDTTGGNSGSPVIFENSGVAIGVHTHGGCTSNGEGNNWGTGSNNAGWQNALANPRGICAGGLGFEYPDGQPNLIDPDGGTTMRVIVFEDGDDPQPGTGMFHYDIGNGFVSVAMNEISPNEYEAEFPAVACGTMVNYYVSAENTGGDEFTDPSNAPLSSYSTISALDLVVAFADDFQSDKGWAVENVNLTDGPWQRAVPAGGGDRGDPPSDYDASGFCFVTDNADDNSDVDGGPTRLISPVINLSDGDATVSYARWFYNDDNDQDRLDVEVSNDDGNNWTLVERVANTNGWEAASFQVGDYVTPTASVRVRFSATDNPNDSVTEAAIDAIKVSRAECDPSVCVRLTVDNLVAGERAAFTVSNGSPGATTAVLWSLKLGSFQFEGNGWCVDFGIDLPPNPNSRIVTRGQFDGNGIFLREVLIPGNARGLDLKFQAAVRDTCPDKCMSNVIEEIVR